MSEKAFMRFLTGDEFNEMLRDAESPTSDDVTITSDGRRLDTKERALAFCAELLADRASAKCRTRSKDR